MTLKININHIILQSFRFWDKIILIWFSRFFKHVARHFFNTIKIKYLWCYALRKKCSRINENKSHICLSKLTINYYLYLKLESHQPDLISLARIWLKNRQLSRYPNFKIELDFKNRHKSILLRWNRSNMEAKVKIKYLFLHFPD